MQKEYKVIQYYLEKPNISINWMSKLFDLTDFEIKKIIEDYKKNPYIIRSSKMNG